MITTMLLIALAAQAQASASSPDKPPIVVKGQKQADQNCRKIREIGSHLMKTICRSDAEQRDLDRKARNVLRLGNVNPNSPGSSPDVTENK